MEQSAVRWVERSPEQRPQGGRRGERRPEPGQTQSPEHFIQLGGLPPGRRIGHPVLGDPKYGLNNKNTDGLKLVAHRLVIPEFKIDVQLNESDRLKF